MAIPARNEEARLPRVLAALDRQFLLSGERLHVLLLINNTTDRSAAVAEACRGTLRNVDLAIAEACYPLATANVGMARKDAMDQAFGLAPAGSPVILMTTDADAEPDPDWVAANRRGIDAGADLVAGRIVADPQEEALLGNRFVRRSRSFDAYCETRTRLASILDPADHDPWPRHHFEMAGSLAVRGEVYLAVGGLEPLPYREDLAFVSRVKAGGYRVRHSVEAIVSVSARTSGRAPQGMSQSFARWKVEAEQGQLLMVEHPDRTIARLLLRRDLRSADAPALRARLRLAGFPDIGLPDCQIAARATAIELLAQDDLDACDVPVEMAVARLRQAMHRLAATTDSRELAHAG